MKTWNKLLLVGVLVAAPFTVTAANAQSRPDMSSSQQDRATNGDQRDTRDQRDMRDQRNMRDRRDGDRRDSHRDWRGEHRYDRHNWRGRRDCVVRWRYHRRVRICR
jgi:hypothetical protein